MYYTTYSVLRFLRMAPSKDACPTCSGVFYGRQKFLKCVGPCGLRFHLDCINIGDAEYDIYTQSGSSSYKCLKCVSASKSSHGDNTPVRSSNGAAWKKVISPTRELVLPNLSSSAAEGLSVQIETVRLNSVSLIDMVSDILEYVKSLQKDMCELKNENVALKLQVSELLSKGCSPLISDHINTNNGQQSNQSSYPILSNSYSKVLSQNIAADNTSACNSADSATRRTLPATTITLNQHNKQSELPTANVPTDSIDAEGFQLVTKKKYRKREPKVGTMTSTLEMAPVRIKSKSLFVSRFSSKVNATNIEDTLKNQLNLRSLVVTKLKTKFQTYSSFHISVDERDFELINNAEVWPAGCLIAPFYGKLKSEQHFTPPANSDSVSVDSRENTS